MVLEAMSYRLRSYGLSDIGHVRNNNEDVWAELPDYNFFVLADGMGGHRAGEVAAEEAVKCLSQQVKEMVGPETPSFSFEEAQGMIQFAIENTNLHVHEMSRADATLSGMGTTICCLYFHPKGVICGHVGDSRIYRLRSGVLEQLTRDHSLLREMIDKGHLTDREGEEAGFKNVITRAIGTEQYIEPSVHMTEVVDGDIYIMCTDGLTDMLTQREIQTIVNQCESIEAMTFALIESAKRRGGHDNVTVVAVETRV